MGCSGHPAGADIIALYVFLRILSGQCQLQPSGERRGRWLAADQTTVIFQPAAVTEEYALNVQIDEHWGKLRRNIGHVLTHHIESRI